MNVGFFEIGEFGTPRECMRLPREFGTPRDCMIVCFFKTNPNQPKPCPGGGRRKKQRVEEPAADDAVDG